MTDDDLRPERWIGITPGTGTAVVGRQVAVLLAAGPDHPLVGELWTVVGADDGGFDAVLSVLGAAGFDRLPDLAMAGWEDARPRVVVRGDVAVAVGSEDGCDAVEIAGAEVHSWAEHTVPHDGTVHMRLGPLPRGAAASGSYVVDRGRLPAVALAIPTRPGAHNEADEPDDGVQEEEGEALYSTVLVGGLPSLPTRSAAAEGLASELRPGTTPEGQPQPRQGESRPHSSTDPSDGDAEDDGHTIVVEQLRNAFGATGDPAATDRVGPSTIDDGLLAVRCAGGHLNPLHGHRCRVCDAPLSTDSPELVATLELGIFRFSTGAVVEVNKAMLIGRSPRLAGEVRGEVPDLVPVPSPDQDISRTHLEVRLEGWQVLLVDKGSINGTTVTLPGRGPQRLRPDQPYPLPLGAVVCLAEEVEFAFEAGR